MVVPFPPGGSNDVMARILSQKLTERWGQQFVIDNRGGAGGMIGAETVARATPDGYTLMLTNQGPSVHNVLLRSKPPYTLADFASISYVGYTPIIVVSYPKFAANDVRGLVAYAKEHPGRVNWASPGVNSNPHIAIEMFKAATGVQVAHVPYKGTGPALTDLMAGQVDALHTSVIAAETLIKSGRVKVLGVAAAKRHPALPNVQTFAEQGIKGADVLIWYGVVAAARTPKPLIDQLNRTINDILQQPDLRQRMDQLGVEIEGGAPNRLDAVIQNEAQAIGKLIATGALKKDQATP